MDIQRDAQAIDRIGADVIRDHFGISRQALHYWRKNGIPDRHRNSLAALAETRADAAVLGDGKRDKWFASRSIYAIVDAEDRVRYVGKTHKEPMVRAADHMASCSKVGAWMRENAWTVKVLQVATAQSAAQCERTWIAKMHADGHPLFNAQLVPAN